MTNRDRADTLLADAAAILDEARNAMVAGRANLAVRRAQEVVELAMKAVLLWAGRDYPRVHDVGPAVVRTLAECGVPVDPAFAAWLVEVSGELARQRAPAFYGEADFDEHEAAVAGEAASRVLSWARTLVI